MSTQNLTKVWGLVVFCLVLNLKQVNSKTVTIHNDQVRRAVDGSYVDAHDGLILEHNGTYFLYGEAYNETTLATPYPWPNYPRLSVYTSTDMVNWTYRGGVLPDSVPGTLWIPNVIFDKKTSRFIMWFGAGGWGSAVSTDGIHFTPGPRFESRFGPKAGTDGTGLFIDDDGQGYVVFASSPTGIDEGPGTWPGHPHALGFGHIVSIERMSADFMTSTKINVSGFFPDDYVESPSLFKRKGVYYVTYGSCCCGCREGGGIVVFTSKSVLGPWVRQAPHADVNCNNSSALICGGFGLRSQDASSLVFDAQWWGPSFIPLANGETSIVFTGRRWLSGENNPPGCNDICGNNGKRDLCRNSQYLLRSDFSVWYPLEFDDVTGSILPFHPLPSFTLDIPG
eukprot:m.83882 g.83882  ORF g.83882 m.83882 type:complete len:395 (+) comp25683_c0_seq1:126-1310(+)